MKNMYELYPERVRTRMAREYRETLWEPIHKTSKATTLRELREFEDKHPEPLNDSFDEKIIGEDLKSKVDFLEEMDTKYRDLGPTYDCVVFYDGSHW